MARCLLVATCAAAIGFSAGLLTERQLGRLMPSEVGAAAPAATSVPTPSQYPLARAVEFEGWLARRSSQPFEPILHPLDLSAAIYPCGETPSPCSTQRVAFQATLAGLRSDPKKIRDVAYCMQDGCEGAVARLPANACFWWSLYIVHFPADKGAMDERNQKQACADARLGPEDRRRSLTGEWEREARRAIGLFG